VCDYVGHLTQLYDWILFLFPISEHIYSFNRFYVKISLIFLGKLIHKTMLNAAGFINKHRCRGD